MMPGLDAGPPLFGEDPALRRMLYYWAATALLYLAYIVLLLFQLDAGFIPREPTLKLIALGAAGTLFFCLPIRFSATLRMAPVTLAVSQALFSIACSMGAYALGGPLRSALLTIPVVTVAFCTFALRPRQTLWLSSAVLGGMGAAMWWLQAHDPQRFPPAVEAMTFGYLAVGVLSTALLTGEMTKLRRRMKRQRRELEQALGTIRTLATMDELTSLANRRHMNEVLAAEERRHPHRASACVALLDIDFFKRVNDRHGHAVGDAVLRNFAATARACVRSHDVLARWGGEEFLLLLPDTPADEARMVLERMAQQVRTMRVPGLEPDKRVSFSAGLAARRDGEAFADAIGRADKALYRAKASGRDRIEQD